MFRFLSIVVSLLLLKVSIVATVKDRLRVHGSSNTASSLCGHKQAAEDLSFVDVSASVSTEGNVESSSSEDIVEKKQRVVPLCPLNPVIVLKPVDKVAFSKQCMDPKRKRVRGGMDLCVLRISEVSILEENRYVCKRQKPTIPSQEEQDFMEPLAERKRKREENEARAAEAEKMAKKNKEAFAEAKKKEKEDEKRTKAETKKKKVEDEKKAKEERDKLEKDKKAQEESDKSAKKKEKEDRKAQEEYDKSAKKKRKEDRKAQEESDKSAAKSQKEYDKSAKKREEKEAHKRRKEVEAAKEKERRKADRSDRANGNLKVRADNKRDNENNVPIDLNSAANYDANRYIVSSFHSFIYQEHSKRYNIK